MLFNYHVKEMFGQCAFFPSNTKKTEEGAEGEEAAGPQCEDALTRVGTTTYCTL